MRASRIVLATLSILAMAIAACEPSERLPNARSPKCPPCPPPPEPAYQAVVVGTIGKMHMVESRYPLARIVTRLPVTGRYYVRVHDPRAATLESGLAQSYHLSVIDISGYPGYTVNEGGATPTEAVPVIRQVGAGSVEVCGQLASATLTNSTIWGPAVARGGCSAR